MYNFFHINVLCLYNSDYKQSEHPRLSQRFAQLLVNILLSQESRRWLASPLQVTQAVS